MAEATHASAPMEPTTIAKLSRDEQTQILLQLGQFELLPLRAVSKHWRDAVAMAVRQHDECRKAVFPRRKGAIDISQLADPLRMPIVDPAISHTCIETRGRIFGSGCQQLRCCGTMPYVLATLSFVSNTVRLLALDVSNSAVTNAILIELCRHAPRLTKLEAHHGCDGLNVYEATGDAENVAATIGGLCPDLQRVRLPGRHPDHRNMPLSSPAESYARHFPKLDKLEVNSGYLRYELDVSTVLAAIECCPNITILNANACVLNGTTLPDITAPLAKQLVKLKLLQAEVLPSTLVESAAACRSLRSIQMPDGFYEAADYLALAQACPSITKLSTREIDDDGLAAIFRNLRLEKLSLGNNETVTDASTEALVGTPSAESLVDVELEFVARLTEIGVLRIAQHTNVRNLFWYAYDIDVDEEGNPFGRREVPRAALDAIADAMEARGGTTRLEDENGYSYDYESEEEEDEVVQPTRIQPLTSTSMADVYSFMFGDD